MTGNQKKGVSGKNCHFFKQCKSKATSRIKFRGQSVAVCKYHEGRLKRIEKT